jgi:hypothetical protein
MCVVFLLLHNKTKYNYWNLITNQPMPSQSENKSIVKGYKKCRRVKGPRYARYDMDAPENAPKYCKYEDPRVCREDFSGIDYVNDGAYLTSVHQTQKMFRLVHPGIIYYYYSFNL